MNGFDTMMGYFITEQENLADQIVKKLEERIDDGYNPNDVLDEVLDEFGNPDLTSYQKNTIKRKIERYVNR